MNIVSISNPLAQSQALAVLANGGLVICPTETVYGALVDACNPTAVAKLLAYKKRPVGKALSIACCDQEMASTYVKINEQADKIYSTLLPGPVTVISENLGLVVSDIVSEFNTLGVRLPNYPFLIDLIRNYALPLTATSANGSGQKTPYCLDDIFTHLSLKQKNLIDLVIDAGTLSPNPPSLVIDTTLSTPLILRENKTIQQKNIDKSSFFLTKSDLETQQLAGKILLKNYPNLLQSGLIIGLDGPLGAGKTTFTQGIAQFLGIKRHLTSPTYTYLKEYAFNKFNHSGTLYHLDAWTIDTPEFLATLELDSILQPGNLLVIEWYQNIQPFFQPAIPTLQLILEENDNSTQRKISLLNP